MDIVPSTSMEIPTTPMEDDEPLNTEIQPNKRRRKQSVVWEHFTRHEESPGCTKARCNQCNKSFAYITGAKLAGTSHLKRHIALGICPVSKQKNLVSPLTPAPKTDDTKTITHPPKRRYRASPGSAHSSVDQGRCSHELAKMIIQHDYPLDIVEHSGFVRFVRTIQPHFNMVSFNTVHDDCLKIYHSEKENLLNLLGGIYRNVSLSLDLWTSDDSFGYLSVTGHFIDGDWKVHRRTLSVARVASPDSDDALTQAVAECLHEWRLENRIFTLAIDNSILNEARIENLRCFSSVKSLYIMLNGQFFIGNCYARLLSCLAQDAIGALSETVGKIRESVKYVKTSDSREENFMVLKRELRVPSAKTLFVDNQAKWDTTYHMLVAACELKEVFALLDTCDIDYKETPSMDEWKQAETLLSYLKLFYDSAYNLTSSTYPTFSFFFYEAWKIYLELRHAAANQDPFVSNLTRPLHEKFEKYWRDSSLVLAVAVVMDPRYKRKLVEFIFSKIYLDDHEGWLNLVDEGVRELFHEYFRPSLLPPPVVYMDEPNIDENGHASVVKTEVMHHQDEEHLPVAAMDELSDFDVYISESATSHHSRSELDQYLDEALLPRDGEFDILGWWRLNTSKYPTLSRMASDMLSIPVCTVAPESVFDTVSKKITSYQSSLRPVTLEALVCAKDWLRQGSAMPHSQRGVSDSNGKLEF